jgi:hypothetical protein
MKFYRTIFFVTLIAGTLDITAACLSAYLLKGTMPALVLKYITSGVLGAKAFNGSVGVMMLGLLFHYFISFCCTIVFFWLYPQLKFLQKSILMNALLIGFIAWLVTTQLVIPLSNISKPPFQLTASLRAVIILIICIGLPVSFAAKKYYQTKNNNT